MKLRTLLGLDRASVRLEGGKRLTLKPLTLKQSLVIERAFEPVAISMAEMGMEADELYAMHADDLILVVATAVGQKPGEVEAWSFGDFKKVLSRLLEINRNFFSSLVVIGAAKAAIKEAPMRSTGD